MTLNPNVQTLLQQGHDQLEQGSYQAGVDTFHQASVLEPQNPQVLYGLGLAYYRLEQYQDAVTYLNQALAMQPNYILALARRGMAYQQIKQAKRDRNLNNTVAIAGVGLATSQIASSIILAQEPPPQDLPFFQTTAFWWSLATGLVASLILWSILRLYGLITHSRR